MSVVCSGIYIFIWHKHYNANIGMIFAFIPIACLGHFLYSIAGNMGAAIAAQKTVYLGSTFLQLFMLLGILDLCQIRIGRWIRTLLYVCCTAAFSATLTIGYTDQFYRSISFEIREGTSVLVREYGWMHTAYFVFVVAFFIADIIVILYSWGKKRQVPRTILVLITVPYFIVLVSYFAGRRIYSLMDLMPVGYLIAQVTYLIISARMNLYDVADTAIDSMVHERAIGYVSFDFKYRYLGSNESARRLIPQLRFLVVDGEMGDSLGERKLRHFIDCFRENPANHLFTYTVHPENRPKADEEAGNPAEVKAQAARTAEVKAQAARMAEAKPQTCIPADGKLQAGSLTDGKPQDCKPQDGSLADGKPQDDRLEKSPEDGDRIYNVNVNYLYDGNRRHGYIVTFTDDTANRKYIRLLDSYNEKLQSEVEWKTSHIVEMHDNLIMSLAMMVESRDNSTGGHIKRTSQGVRILIDEIQKEGQLNLPGEFCADVIKAAPMHDLGKIAVDDAVLRKPGRFTEEEYEKMKRHAAEGARVIHEILLHTDDESFKSVAENVAHYHHERWDGTGYPEKLSGEQIPLEARIMAVADVYDALVSKRVYKEAFNFEKANRIILEGMGTQFDPGLKKVYLHARGRLEAYYAGLV